MLEERSIFFNTSIFISFSYFSNLLEVILRSDSYWRLINSTLRSYLLETIFKLVRLLRSKSVIYFKFLLLLMIKLVKLRILDRLAFYSCGFKLMFNVFRSPRLYKLAYLSIAFLLISNVIRFLSCDRPSTLVKFLFSLKSSMVKFAMLDRLWTSMKLTLLHFKVVSLVRLAKFIVDNSLLWLIFSSFRHVNLDKTSAESMLLLPTSSLVSAVRLSKKLMLLTPVLLIFKSINHFIFLRLSMFFRSLLKLKSKSVSFYSFVNYSTDSIRVLLLIFRVERFESLERQSIELMSFFSRSRKVKFLSLTIESTLLRLLLFMLSEFNFVRLDRCEISLMLLKLRLRMVRLVRVERSEMS